MNLAVVPARGGSKRIPRKNIRNFFGKPMILWTLDALKESGCFDTIVVSTDDEDIAEVARDWGALVPFLRPAELSGDFVGITPVVAHAASWLNQSGREAEYICCALATAPFLRAEDIVRGYEQLVPSRANFSVSVTSYPYPIQRALMKDVHGIVSMFQPEHVNTRSQDLAPAFHDAAQFYWGRCRAWMSEASPLDGALGVQVPRDRVIDIDTPEDWDFAERLFRAIDHK